MSERDDAAKIAAALRATLISPNETDTNLEPANIVDALFIVGRTMNSAARDLAASNRKMAQAMAQLAAAVRAGQKRKPLPGEPPDLRNEDWSGWEDAGMNRDE